MKNIQEISDFLKAPVHGVQEARSIMRPAGLYVDKPDTTGAQLAAVVILLFKKDEKWHTVYMLRRSHPNDKHSGQISFPGGKYEQSDENLETCALRELAEETGIDVSNVKILGKLNEVFVKVSNFLVVPFVGVVDAEPKFTPDKTEVEKLIVVSIPSLVDPKLRDTVDITVRGNVLKDIPYFDLKGHTLWGATAIMTAELLHRWDAK